LADDDPQSRSPLLSPSAAEQLEVEAAADEQHLLDRRIDVAGFHRRDTADRSPACSFCAKPRTAVALLVSGRGAYSR
jgi:hypothetical protein